ncbi:hypothetical protein TYRP_023750, partial [Tyrophagus putrescentiae]
SPSLDFTFTYFYLPRTGPSSDQELFGVAFIHQLNSTNSRQDFYFCTRFLLFTCILAAAASSFTLSAVLCKAPRDNIPSTIKPGQCHLLARSLSLSLQRRRHHHSATEESQSS